jgi:hypothetical protein
MGIQINTLSKPYRSILTRQVQTAPPVKSKEDLKDIFLSKLGLSKKCYLALNRVNIWTVEDIKNLTRKDLLAIPRIGDTAISEIETALIKKNVYDRTVLGGASKTSTVRSAVKPVEILDKESIKYHVPTTKKTYSIYTWFYLEDETKEDLEVYKDYVVNEYRRRFNIAPSDEVNIVWDEYLPESITGYEPLELPQYADIRITALSRSLARMATCTGYCLILGGKMGMPWQVQKQEEIWINSCRKPEFRSPIVLHKENILKTMR